MMFVAPPFPLCELTDGWGVVVCDGERLAGSLDLFTSLPPPTEVVGVVRPSHRSWRLRDVKSLRLEVTFAVDKGSVHRIVEIFKFLWREIPSEKRTAVSAMGLK